mgnify:CR=1 FL=1
MFLNHQINYIRNSVKVVIDAYSGETDFYLVDEDDPLVLTYQKIFPTLFKPLSEMPQLLRDHIRYPRDMFAIQAAMYRIYHMRNPQVFYNKEDMWAVPQQVYAEQEQQVYPYYAVMKTAQMDKEELLLLLPFTPAGKENMIGWMAAGFALGAMTCFLSLSSRQPLVPILGAALLATIVIYTALHKRTPFAIVPMGICRSLLYLLGYFVVVVTPGSDSGLTPGRAATSTLNLLQDNVLVILALMALGIFTYVAGLTLAARYESRPGQLAFPKVFLWFLIFFSILTHTWWWIWQRPPFLEGWHLAIPALLCVLPFCAWTVRGLFVLRKSIPDFVSRALAGLCLVDLLAFAGIAATIRTGWNALDASPLYLALIPLSCFLFSLLLQRLAPAT